jgi:ATP-binding protein involved in chromosome partitioning
VNRRRTLLNRPSSATNATPTKSPQTTPPSSPPSTGCASCARDECSAKHPHDNESPDEFLERQKLEAALCQIKHTFLVLSGKGGVGKSTVAVNLALSLAEEGYRIGLLDIDIHGPSVPTMLGLTRERALQAGDGHGIAPVPLTQNLLVMSIGFLLERNDQAVVWRGPMKAGVIRQFLGDVQWGPLDALIVDCPPGTGDEPLSMAQSIPKADGAIIVTTPQEVALSDVRRSVSFCHLLNMPILGVIENMSGLACPHCGKTVPLFKQGGGQRLAQEMGLTFLGAIPIDPALVTAADAGEPYVRTYRQSAAAIAFRHAIEPLVARLQTGQPGGAIPPIPHQTAAQGI